MKSGNVTGITVTHQFGRGTGVAGADAASTRTRSGQDDAAE